MSSRYLPLMGIILSAQPAIAEDPALRVEFVTAEEQTLMLDMRLSGTIEARNSVDLGFRQAGRVVEVLVREGDRVTRGEVLARLDSAQQDQALKLAQAGLASAEAGRAQAQQASDRAAAMLSRGVGTRAARDSAVQALSEAEGMVESAQSRVEQARRAVEDTQLLAPDDAVVTQRDLAPGQIVGMAQPVLSLAALDGMEAVFGVADQPMLREAMGRPVRLRALDVERPAMTGIVSEIAPLVDPASGTVTLRARIEDMPGETALLGAAVRGDLTIEGAAGIVVPWTALMRDNGGAAVWVVGQDGRVALTDVTIGSFTDRAVYVADGLTPGQVVVGAGSQLLYPGRAVMAAEVVR
ncbi:MAG: efflux transporter periplasmic adaptor subunit [Paracoccus sp.]|nr:efflux transporter periplasmic adaptor subunit [Paracoccus sp. (in: a-proteobacteria)]